MRLEGNNDNVVINGEPFERRLCKWLIECLEHRGTYLYDVMLQEWIQQNCECEDQLLLIEEDIYHFIKHFGVTHYVSAIELGGLEYSVLTEKEYEKRVAASGNASLTSQLYGGIEASAKRSHQRIFKLRSSERKMIGKITEENTVKEEDVAVIGCQIRPISSLVKNPFLQQALKASVKKYTQEKISTGGPYLISCGDNRIMYLTAHPETKRITITFDKNEADAFSVKTLNESSQNHELEFSLTSSLTKCKRRMRKMSISAFPESPVEESPQDTTIETSRSDDNTDQHSCDGILPLDYILETVVNPLTGRGNKAPRMQLNADYRRTRLLLKKRSDHRISCDTKEWIKGREAYYIQCRHPIHSGFLCVKERSSYRQRQMEAQQNLANDTQQGTQGLRLGLRLARQGLGLGLNQESGADGADQGEGNSDECMRAHEESLPSIETDALVQSAGTIEEQYKVCVKRSANSHDDSQMFMLFRLQPATFNTTRK